MNNLNAANESDRQALSLLEQMGQFELTPCDSAYDFEDKSRFTKLSLSEAQKMHLSACLQHLPSMMAAGTTGSGLYCPIPGRPSPYTCCA